MTTGAVISSKSQGISVVLLTSEVAYKDCAGCAGSTPAPGTIYTCTILLTLRGAVPARAIA